MQNLVEFVKKNDLRFYLERFTLARARKEFEKTGGKATNADVSDAAQEHCNLWKVARRKPIKRNSSCDGKSWDRLKDVASRLAPILNMCTDAVEAAEVMRTQMSCNAEVANGLPRRLRFWETTKE